MITSVSNYHTVNLNRTAWNTAQSVADSSSDYHLCSFTYYGVYTIELVKTIGGIDSVIYTFSNGIWTTADASSTTLHALLK